jgi:hypothetical protein
LCQHRSSTYLLPLSQTHEKLISGLPLTPADLRRKQLCQELHHDPPVGGLCQVRQHPGLIRYLVTLIAPPGNTN